MNAPLSTDRRATWVECNCGHKWIGLYLPLPLHDAGKIMKNLTCPQCANDARQIFLAEESVT